MKLYKSLKKGTNMMENHKHIYGFFQDDGTPINPELVPKPSLCILCRKDDTPSEEIFCILTRVDQQGSPEFICDAFEPKKTKIITTVQIDEGSRGEGTL